MADALKQTLYWSSNPTDFTDDLNGTGFTVSALTAAGSHDSSDSTYGQLVASGNDIDVPSVVWKEYGYLTSYTQTGAISFVRAVIRARLTKLGGSGTSSWTIYPMVGTATAAGSASPNSSITTFTIDMATNPSTGTGWHAADFASVNFGFDSIVGGNDISTSSQARIYEIYFEVWGESGQTLTTTAANAVVAASTGSVVSGLIALGLAAASCSSNASAPALVPVSVTMPMDTATILSIAYNEEITQDTGYPLDLVNQASYVDHSIGAANSSTPVTIRSNTVPYYDLNLATKTLNSSPGTWPNNGTLTFNFGGLTGTTSIDGYGPIAGVKCYATIRPRKNTNAAMSNFRFVIGSDTFVLPTQPVIGGMLPAVVDYQTVVSDLITTVGGDALEWGAGSKSIFVKFTGWSFRCDYSVGGAYTGQFAQCEVAEAWVEVIGYAGSAPTIIELKHKLPNIRRIQTVTTDISN